MAEAETRAILLVIIGGAYFFLALPVVWFRLHRVVRGRGLALFLGAVAVWFLAHLLLALGSPWVGGLLTLSALAMGVAILALAREYARLMEAPDGPPSVSPGASPRDAPAEKGPGAPPP
ncbi:MAG: hypothetical protein QXO51_07650 [Halobacteria archaeon]